MLLLLWLYLELSCWKMNLLHSIVQPEIGSFSRCALFILTPTIHPSALASFFLRADEKQLCSMMLFSSIQRHFIHPKGK